MLVLLGVLIVGAVAGPLIAYNTVDALLKRRQDAAGSPGLLDGPTVMIEQIADPAGLRIVGEIDLANHELLRRALRTLPADGELHLDLAGLGFIDVAGVAELVQFADGPPPRGLVLHSPPAQLCRIADLLWPQAGWRICP